MKYPKYPFNQSFYTEERLIRKDLNYASGILQDHMTTGLYQYHLRRRDSNEFMTSSGDDRMKWAVEEGLIRGDT